MAITMKTSRYYRPFNTISRNYCDKSAKSIYQREEAGTPPRLVHGKPYPEWRKPWIKRDGEWKSKLSVFMEKNPSSDVLNAMSQIPDITFEKIKLWWKSMNELQEIHNQKYISERVAVLGSNLAAMHFFTFRQAAVRLQDSKTWITGDATTLTLPTHYQDGFFVEAIDCTNFHHNSIRYEGLQNLSNLNFLKWLCLKNNKFVDAWCLDRIAGQNGKSIEYLDISGCSLCVGGIFALARMPALKFLVISDPADNIDLQSALSLLEQDKSDLLIKTI